jgi:hypothetical protein
MSVLHRLLDENVAYPPHEPRTESPTYRRTHHHLIYDLDAPCWICGIRHTQGGQMETHHFRFEWASQFGLDLEKVAADFPDLTDRDKLAEWVDSEGNMLVLCLPGDSPVLLADGSQRRLDRMRVGDEVIGHDLRPHRVTDTMSRRVDEEIVVVDGRRMTANHPVLTPAGWLPAAELAPGDVALHVRMGATEMLGLAGEEFEIQQPIVGAIPIDVMNALGRGEPSTNVLLHHEAMLHRRPPLVTIPNRHTDVAARSERVTERLRHSLARERVERCESAGIGAEALAVGRSLDLVTASLADDGAGVDALGLRAAQAAALARTRGVAVGDLRDDQERAPADHAGSLHSRAGAACARWRPISDVRRVTFSGRVHDISVSSCRSFVTDGLVVHNCARHHRAKYEGIHEISYPAWLLQRYQGADWTFIAQHIESHTVTAHTPLIQPPQK